MINWHWYWKNVTRNQKRQDVVKQLGFFLILRFLMVDVLDLHYYFHIEQNRM